MDAFYEESAVNSGAKKGSRRYKIINAISLVCLVLGIVGLVFFLFNFPFGSTDGLAEDVLMQVNASRYFFGFIGIQSGFLILAWFLLGRLKRRFNLSYDYCFVSGELRISKVFNINRRKPLARIDCEDMIQVGDMDNSSYERFKADPTVKEIVCTANDVPADGKFFMYILANYNGKKLFLLECRETLLVNILKFTKRSVLESDYVSQEKKAK